MQALQPTLRLGRDVWDRTAMPVSEFHERADRLRVAMGEAGLDVLLAYGRGLNQCGHPTYLANYIVKLPFAAMVILPRVGEPALLFEGATRGRDAAKATAWIDDVRPSWDLAGTCLTVLAERGLSASTIGLAGMPRLVPCKEWRTLIAGLGQATLVDAEALLDRMRAAKSPREVAQIERASRLVDLAMQRVTATRAAGMSEMDVIAEAVRAARMAGAEDVRLMLARPDERDWAFRPPENRGIESNDTVFLHIAASWERYWSAAICTFRLEAEALQLVWNEDHAARFRRIVAAARLGATVRDIVETARTVMTAGEWQVLARCGLGHAVGVMPEETPWLTEACDDTLASGSCFVLTAAFETANGLVVRAATIPVANT